MEKQELIGKIDHTVLAPSATWEDVRRCCDEGMRYGTASVCIPPSYVRRAKEYTGGKLAVCTVIGFPNGYATKEVKVFETEDAVKNGADEIDMVIDIGALKSGRQDAVEDEVKAVRAACPGKILKVIVEACLLSREEKIAMCGVVTRAGADYIKTSTGFAKGGATFDDIRLFREHIGPGVKMKAAGGIHTVEDAEKFAALGCSRIGASSLLRQLTEK